MTPVRSDEAIIAAAPRGLLNPTKLESGIGLSLSGGGYRAMLFHLGALCRLNEVGLLSRIDRIASVSGGSLAAGALALRWKELEFGPEGVALNFNRIVGDAILSIAQVTIDVRAILLGLLPGLSASSLIARALDRGVCRGATLQDLPDAPHFVFIATSLQTGAIWRFAKRYAADYRVGEWRDPALPLAVVMAASASFPPYCSPCRIPIPKGRITPLPGNDLHHEPYTRELVLTDGGVYDNLGLEPIWKRYTTLLVSDGGAVTRPTARPWRNWLSQSLRANDIAMQQVIYLRRRFLRDLDLDGKRKTAVWAIAEQVATSSPQRVNFTHEEAARAAAVPTRLKRFSSEIQNLLIRSGYAHCDAALRASSLEFSDVAPDLSSLPSAPFARSIWRL